MDAAGSLPTVTPHVHMLNTLNPTLNTLLYRLLAAVTCRVNSAPAHVVLDLAF